MSGKRKKHHGDRDDDNNNVPKKSLVDYSKVSGHPDANTRRSGEQQNVPAPAAAAAAPPAGSKMSAQMEAVMRLMTGREERTIAQKLADSNRPSWEQYKKDNEDKLNLEGIDQKKMEEYRRELDAEREKKLTRGLNHGAKKKKKRKKYRSSDADDDASESDDGRERRKKKKHKRKKEEKKQKRRRDDSSNDEQESERSSSEQERQQRKKRKKKKISRKDRDKEKDDENSDGEHYRLSNFFTAGSDEDD